MFVADWQFRPQDWAPNVPLPGKTLPVTETPTPRPTYLITTTRGTVIPADVHIKPQRTTLLFIHGTPRSRIGPTPSYSVLYRMGICLIVSDKWGYGSSSRFPGHSVTDIGEAIDAIGDF